MTKIPKLDLLLTADGSHTIHNSELGVTYHSVHGAISESQHVFIAAGLKPLIVRRPRLRILEIGFGTGLNVILSYLEARHANVALHYTAYEPHPLPLEWVRRLNYAEVLLEPEVAPLLEHLHAAADTPVVISDFFEWQLHRQDFAQHAPLSSCDLVYFDAFAPSAQPELWGEEIFHKLATLQPPGGVLVTFCAKGEVRRSLKKAGYEVEKLPGAVGKREMTRAIRRG